MYKAAESAA